jgi:hypothetical protein
MHDVLLMHGTCCVCVKPSSIILAGNVCDARTLSLDFFRLLLTASQSCLPCSLAAELLQDPYPPVNSGPAQVLHTLIVQCGKVLWLILACEAACFNDAIGLQLTAQTADEQVTYCSGCNCLLLMCT